MKVVYLISVSRMCLFAWIYSSSSVLHGNVLVSDTDNGPFNLENNTPKAAEKITALEIEVNRAVIIFQDILSLSILKQIVYKIKRHILKHICSISSSRNIFRIFDLYDFSITVELNDSSLTTWPHLHIRRKCVLFKFLRIITWLKELNVIKYHFS